MNVVPLVQATDSKKFGGKASNLAKMMQAGFSVPPGIAVSTDAYKTGFTAGLEKEILNAFDSLGFERVAVRSSAVAEDSSEASWAGQLESVLNVKREGLIDAIKYCWNSIKSDRAQTYAKEHKVPKKNQNVAVVIQAMVDASTSGVVFTANPVNGNHNEMMIEAIYGLGEYLVQGIVTPENYTVESKTGKVIEHSNHRQTRMLVYKNGKNTEVKVSKAKQDVLKQKQLKELIRISKKIENYYGQPQDIEFAFDNDKLYIVQSRPITTLNKINLPAFFSHCVKSIARPATLQRDELFRFTSNNVASAEVVTLPLGDMNRAYYLEKNSAKEIFKNCLNKIKSMQDLKNHLEDFNDLKRQALDTAKFISDNLGDYKTALKKYRDYLVKLSPFLYTALAIDAVVYPQFKEIILKDYPNQSAKILDFVATPKALHDYQKFRLAVCNLKVAKSKNTDSILNEYGHINEYSFVERLTTADDIHKELEALSETAAKAEIKDIESSIDNSQPGWLKKLLTEELFTQAMTVKEYALLRTSRIDYLKRVQLKLRKVYENMAAELKSKDLKPWTKNHLVNFLDSEIDDYINQGIVPSFDEINKRLDQSYLYFYTDNKTSVITDQKVIEQAKNIVIKPEDFESQSIISPGTVAYPGSVSGRVVRINSKKDLNKIKKGDIMVAHVTMPEYTIAMKQAAGFITAEGGITSHAAIVARELAKPCIVGADNCMQVLKTGDYILLDSANQLVKYAPKTDFYLGEPEDLFYWGPSRAEPLYMSDFMVAVEQFFLRAYHDKSLPNPPKTIALFINDKNVWLINAKAFAEFTEKTFEAYAKRNMLDEDTTNWKASAEKLNKLKDKKLIETLVEAWNFTEFAEFSLYGAELAVTKMLNRFDEKTRQEIWGVFTVPDKPTFLNRIDKELLNSKNPEQLAVKYPWIQDGYQGHSEDAVKYFNGRLQTLNQNPDDKKIRKTKDRQVLAKKFMLSDDELAALKLTRRLAEFMDDRKAWMMQTRKLLGGFPKTFVKYKYGWLFEDGRVQPLSASQTEQLWERYVDFKASSSIVQGIVASNAGKHYVHGEVALISSPSDDVGDDKILVVPSTSPSYVPLMRKARALITDHGGMMSHAAIVAREFGLPCIVGTKQATKILKTGDKVVLDLVKGVVNL